VERSRARSTSTCSSIPGRRTFTITSRPVLRRHGPGGPPSKPPISGRSGLKTRRLHALSRKKAVDGGAVDAQDPPDANGIEPSVVNQPPDGLGMDAELARDLTNAHQVTRVSAYRRHNLHQVWQVPRSSHSPRGRASLRKGPRVLHPAVSAASARDGERSARIELDLGAVARSVGPEVQGRQERRSDEDCKHREVDEASLRHVVTSLHGLETDILKSIGSLPVQPCGRPIVASARGEIALRDPRRRAMAGGGKLVVGLLAESEGVLGLVEAVLL
jgi:hypothetical protein